MYITLQIAKSTDGGDEGAENIENEINEDTGNDEENPEAEDDQNLPGQVEEDGEDAGDKEEEEEGDGEDAAMDEEPADPAPEEDVDM